MFSGIDEAGRGPVLGPMVYGGFVCAIDGDHDRVLKREIGVDDSKKLTAVSRDAKFRQLNTPDRQFAICAEVLTPKFISYKMLQRCVLVAFRFERVQGQCQLEHDIAQFCNFYNPALSIAGLQSEGGGH